MLGDPITELTIAMEVNYFQLNSAEYFVPVAVKIPGSELALARKGGAEHTLIDFIGEVKDEYNITVANVRDKVDIKLSGETAAQLAKQPIQYDTGFTLLPGTYSIKFLARDAETGRIGTYLTKFVIPNLNKEQKRIPISSVVLSSQRVAMQDSLFTAGKDKTPTANPLVQDGQKLIPSVTRVFSRSRDMYVYLQAYERGAGDDAAAGGVRDLLSRADEGVRDGAAAGDGRAGPEIEGGAAAVQPGAEQAAAGPIQLPGDGGRSDRAEGRVLAGSGDAGAVGRHYGLKFVAAAGATGYLPGLVRPPVIWPKERSFRFSTSVSRGSAIEARPTTDGFPERRDLQRRGI